MEEARLEPARADPFQALTVAVSISDDIGHSSAKNESLSGNCKRYPAIPRARFMKKKSSQQQLEGLRPTGKDVFHSR